MCVHYREVSSNRQRVQNENLADENIFAFSEYQGVNRSA
jgi:hypothetical protein